MEVFLKYSMIFFVWKQHSYHQKNRNTTFLQGIRSISVLCNSTRIINNNKIPLQKEKKIPINVIRKNIDFFSVNHRLNCILQILKYERVNTFFASQLVLNTLFGG